MTVAYVQSGVPNTDKYFHNKNCELIKPYIRNYVEVLNDNALHKSYRPCKCIIGFRWNFSAKKWVKNT